MVEAAKAVAGKNQQVVGSSPSAGSIEMLEFFKKVQTVVVCVFLKNTDFSNVWMIFKH